MRTSACSILLVVIAGCETASESTRLQATCAAPSVTGYFRYDGLERLRASWHDLDHSSESAPTTEYKYAYATEAKPASIETETVMDARSGTVRREAALMYGDGSPLASLTAIPEGWAVGSLVTRDRSHGGQRSLVRSPLPSVAADSIQHADLIANATLLAERQLDGFGAVRSTAEVMQSGVHDDSETTRALVDGAIVATTRDNGVVTGSSAVDEDGMLLWRTDASGATTKFTYDAARRLVAVSLPDGAAHVAGYDSYGTRRRIARSGLATIEYDHNPGTGLLTSKRTYDSTGTLQQTVAWSRDAVGRVTDQTSELPDGSRRTFRFDYDGLVDGQGPLPGQRGRLTRVRGEEFERQTVYAPDGTLLETRMTIDGWRTLLYHADVYDDRSPAAETWTVLDATGLELQQIRIEHAVDTSGRASALRVNGSTALTLTYDAEGQLSAASTPQGETFSPRYDPVTRHARGRATTRDAASSAVDWQVDSRGLVTSETYQVGDTISARTYDYDSRGFLVRSSGDAYTYSSAGLKSTSVAFMTDTLGRVVDKGDLHLEYGPSGHVERATRGTLDLAYRYDESGHRIAKLASGAYVAAYIGDAYLTADHLILPVHVGGHLIGLLDNGVFQSIDTDARGTVIADGGGSNLATPYGQRTRPLSSAIDYVARGYDADLDAIRMGVRDYDPELGRFRTPDPLYLEEPERAGGDPVSANLYSYARNNPLSYVDATGEDPRYDINIRSFAPWDTFGMGMHGDGRSFSTARGQDEGGSVSSRISQHIWVDLGSPTENPWNYASSSVTKYATLGGKLFWRPNPATWGRGTVGRALPISDARITLVGSSQRLESHVEGSNPLVRGAPDIDVYSSMTISMTAPNVLHVEGRISGDAFPAEEALIRDESGRAVMLHTFVPDVGKNIGPLTRLPGGGKDAMGGFSVDIMTDGDGLFESVVGRDGRRWTIEQWNDRVMRFPAYK